MYNSTAQTQPILNQIKNDFQNTRNRVMVAQVMKANGFSRTEIEAEIEKMKSQTSDLADLILSRID